MKATASSWKNEPFKTGLPIPVQLEIPEAEFELIKNGLIPEEMEDKWFIYYEEPYLFFHRSWTGQAVYRVEFLRSGSNYVIREALFSAKKADPNELEYSGKIVHFLISNLLLNRNIPFPMPDAVTESTPGLYQHAISGSGYQEKKVKLKGRW